MAAVAGSLGFGVMNLLNFLFGSSALGFAALVPLYAHDRYGMRSLEAGPLLTARAIGMIAIGRRMNPSRSSKLPSDRRAYRLDRPPKAASA